MDDPVDLLPDDKLKSASRRNFIKGVIAGGVAASSANYLFRASSHTDGARRNRDRHLHDVPRAHPLFPTQSLPV